MERNYSVDTLKFFLAFLVVMAHCPTQWDSFIEPIYRITVPGFLMISGYFLYHSDPKVMNQTIRRSIGKICKITMLASALYITIFVVRNYLLLSSGINNFASFAEFETWLGIFIFNNNPFGRHLWYLQAMIYTLVLCYIVNLYNLRRIAYVATPILLLLCCALGKYSFIFGEQNQIPMWVSRNFLLFAAPFFFAGMYIKANYKRITDTLTTPNLTIIAILSLMVGYTEYIFLNQSVGDLYIGGIPLAISVFLLTLRYSQHIDNALSKVGRNHSLNIYIYHILVLLILEKGGEFLLSTHPDLLSIYTNALPFTVFFATFFASQIARQIMQKSPNLRTT